MDLFVAGRDQIAAIQPNALGLSRKIKPFKPL